MDLYKILLLNQSRDEVLAFRETTLNYCSAFLGSVADFEKEGYTDGHTQLFSHLEDLRHWAIGENCTFIASYQDETMELCAQVADQLGLESNAQITNYKYFTDKFENSCALERLGFKQTTDFGHLPAQFEKTNNLIIKPRNSNGSRYVYHTDTITENQLALITDNQNLFFWERYLQGEEFSVDGYVADGKVSLFGYAKKGTFFEGNFVESSHLVSTDTSLFETFELKEKLERFFQSIQYKYGPFHVEFKINGDRLSFIEFHQRPGGDFLLNSFIDLEAPVVETIIAHLTGKELPTVKPNGKFVYIQYFDTEPFDEEAARALQDMNWKKYYLSEAPRPVRESKDRYLGLVSPPMDYNDLCKQIKNLGEELFDLRLYGRQKAG